MSGFNVPNEIKTWYTYRNIWEEIRDDMRLEQMKKTYKFEDIIENYVTTKMLSMLS